MTLPKFKTAALPVTAFASLALAGPALAASDYLLKLDGIPGESKIVTGAGPGAGPHVKATAAEHKGWIELESVQLGTARAAGGVTVAAGDVNGDGVRAPRDVATGQSTGKRTHKPVRISSSRESSTPSVSEISVTRESSAPSISEITMSREASAPSVSEVVVTKASDAETASLLLPAVQKIREASARMTPWTGCAAGQHIGSVTIRQVSTGKEGTIIDPVVTICASETVSFNFSKIEWK